MDTETLAYATEEIHYLQYYGEERCTVYAIGWYTPEQKKGEDNYWFSSRVFFSKKEDKTDDFAPLMKRLCKQLKAEGILKEIDAITIMPGHKWGHMSPTLHRVALELSTHLGIPYAQILKRVKNGQPHHARKNMTLQERHENCKDSLAIDHSKFQKEWKRVLILDDVKTTGISIMEARKTLLAGGVISVLPICFAINK